MTAFSRGHSILALILPFAIFPHNMFNSSLNFPPPLVMRYWSAALDQSSSDCVWLKLSELPPSNHVELLTMHLWLWWNRNQPTSVSSLDLNLSFWVASVQSVQHVTPQHGCWSLVFVSVNQAAISQLWSLQQLWTTFTMTRIKLFFLLENCACVCLCDMAIVVQQRRTHERKETLLVLCVGVRAHKQC